MSKAKKVWLARDEFNQDAFYELWTTKPRQNRNGEFYADGKRCFLIEDFCPEEFERITGFSLKPGECKRVTIEIKIV